MATSVIEICNRALRAIGENTITALTDDSTRAGLCDLQYEPVRDAVLRAHPWKFAITRTDLAASATTPAFGYDLAYPLPSDNIRLLAIYDSSGERIDDDQSWMLESGSIVTDATAPIYIKYVKREENPAQFDPLFDEALVARLAATIANDMSKEAKTIDRQWDLYSRKIAEAQFVDSTESSAQDDYVSLWEEVRA